MGSSSKKVTVGYKYYAGMHMVLCHGPVDRVLRIRVDNRDAWLGSRGAGRISINQPDLFGGESREGGVQGEVDFETGHNAQGQNSYLTSKLGNLVPAFRGVAGFVLRQVYLGLNPYLKPWSFRLQRIHTRQNGMPQWYDSRAEIAGAGQFNKAQAFLFAVDKSSSMNEIVSGAKTRLDVVKEQLVLILDQINTMRKDSSSRVSISICAWSGAYTDYTRSNVNDADIDYLKNCVVSIVADSLGTNFSVPFNFANQWFGSATNNGTRRDTMLFLTDGEPTFGSENTVVQVGSELINRTGRFSAATGNAVDIYAINIDLTNTTFTALVDNTPNDGIPVVSAGDTSALYNAVFFAVTGNAAAMNPAHIIRECLTEPLWGMNAPESDIDEDSFRAAADRLYTESMGISITWDTQTTIEDFISLIARHIDATVYVDRVTGKWVLKLIRNDYNADSLLVLDENNIESITDFSRPAFGELTNSVTVSYWNAEIGDTSTITVQDIALSQQQGATINVAVDYPGFVNPAVASRAAQRDLTSLSTPTASCTIVTNRIAENLNIGSVFKLSWKDYDLSSMIMRVTSIAFGDGRTNKIRITCTQDVFNLPGEAYVITPPPQWEDPTQAPAVITTRTTFELPYYELVQRQGQTVVDSLLHSDGNPDAGYVAAAGVRPSSGQISARVFTNSGGGYADSAALDFCPGAVLNENLYENTGKMATTFAITNLTEAENIELGSWFSLGDEIMAVDAITANSITVKRGVLDTVPIEHAKGEHLIFSDAYAEADPTEYVASDVVNVKLLSVSGNGQLRLVDALEDTVTLSSRGVRPYPPGNFKINNEYFPLSVRGDVELSWASRNRRQQTGGLLIGFTDADITPEDGTTYLVTVRHPESNELLFQASEIAGSQYTLDVSKIDLPRIKVELFSNRNGYRSWRPQTAVFRLAAPQANFIFTDEAYSPPNGNAVDFNFSE